MKQIQGTSYNIGDDIVGRALPLAKRIYLVVPTIYWFVKTATSQL